MRNEFLARYLVNSVFSQVWQEGCILILAGRFKPQQELPDNQAPALHEVLSVHNSPGTTEIYTPSHDEPDKQPARLIRCQLLLIT